MRKTSPAFPARGQSGIQSVSLACPRPAVTGSPTSQPNTLEGVAVSFPLSDIGRIIKTGREAFSACFEMIGIHYLDRETVVSEFP